MTYRAVVIIILFLSASLLTNFRIYAQVNIDSLISLSKVKEGKEKLSLLIKIGYYLSSDNPREAIKYLDEAIFLAEQSNNKLKKADALFNKGVALWHLGNISESEQHYDRAKVIYEEFKDTLSLTKLYNSRAINYSMRGRTDLALEIFFKSLDYAKKFADRPTIFNTLFNIGIVFDNRAELDKALEHYIQSLDYCDDIAAKALVENYIAEIYLTKNDLLTAEKYLNEAILHAQRSGDSNSLVWSYTNLGNLNFQQNKMDEAEKNFNKALELARKSEYKLDIIHSLTELGKFYYRNKKYKYSEEYLRESLNLAKEVNSLQDLVNITSFLTKIYSETNRFKEAFEFLKLNTEYSDSLQSITQSENIAKLESNYELRQKQKEAELLKSENELQRKVIETQKIIAILVSILGLVLVILLWLMVRNRRRLLSAQKDLLIKNEEIEISRKEIAAKNKELEVLNSTKDKFFSIIAHDLRNPIAGFVSISDLMETDYDRISDQEKKTLLSQMNNSSKNLIALLENLLTWARLSSNKIEIVKSKSTLSELISSAVNPYEHWAKSKRVNLRIEVPEDKKIETDPFIFQTVVGNLVNNAIKFSNSGDTVTVSTKMENGTIRLSVKDNGVGIPEHRLKNIFGFDNKKTTRGTMNESGTGLGLVLVKELSDKMNWKIEVLSKPQLGSEFIL
ncbi:tetratricopeptide repeat protein, partial [Ignavibacterium album]|uniref:tetratricopeptide repeat-containing sensor histidine kinase n=1 Tax=Ignavibacterium album TaxID=591197 RepID=UPI0038B34E4B